jgi:hypothetical protein
VSWESKRSSSAREERRALEAELCRRESPVPGCGLAVVLRSRSGCLDPLLPRRQSWRSHSPAFVSASFERSAALLCLACWPSCNQQDVVTERTTA